MLTKTFIFWPSLDATISITVKISRFTIISPVLDYFFCLLCWEHPSLLWRVSHLVLESSAEGFYVYAISWCLPLVLIRLINSWKDHKLETDILPYSPCNPALQQGQLNNFVIHQTLEHSAVISHLGKCTAWGKGHSSNMNANISEGWGYEVKGFSHKGNIVLKI